MLKYYIGIDGGGTKTAVVIGTDDGVVLKTIEKSGCSHKAIGIDTVVNIVSESIREITQSIDVSVDDCETCCIGLPCYGEAPDADAEITEKLKMTFPKLSMLIVNDVVVGWAGSLECTDGIHLVAGTGAISYGRSDKGREARANGWSEFFGDEGSCYWVGKQAMALFAQEADGRKPKGALYEIIKNEFKLKNDMDFIDIVEKNYSPYRDKVASFQLFAEKAALAGDSEAKKLYAQAAQHLADSAYAIIKQMRWEDTKIPVSYYGGLFKSGDLILAPLKECLKVINCTLLPPKRTAVEGALLLGIKLKNKEK